MNITIIKMGKQDFIQVLQDKCPFSETSARELLACAVDFSFARNQIILNKGEVSGYMYFIKKGAVRIFYTKHGKEVTEWLALEHTFFLSIASFYRQLPSHLTIQALETCEIIALPYDAFMQLSAKYHDIETLHRTLITYALLLSQDRMDSIQFESAHQRYENLVQLQPNFIQRFPLTYIASFLGITLETLSRVRAK